MNPLTTTFNRNHPIGSTVRIKGLKGRYKLSGKAYVSEQGTVLASFTGELKGAHSNGDVPVKVLFNIKTIKP